MDFHAPMDDQSIEYCLDDGSTERESWNTLPAVDSTPEDVFKLRLIDPLLGDDETTAVAYESLPPDRDSSPEPTDKDVVAKLEELIGDCLTHARAPYRFAGFALLHQLTDSEALIRAKDFTEHGEWFVSMPVHAATDLPDVKDLGFQVKRRDERTFVIYFKPGGIELLRELSELVMHIQGANIAHRKLDAWRQAKVVGSLGKATPSALVRVEVERMNAMVARVYTELHTLESLYALSLLDDDD